jgi:hypothetical protein
MAKITIDKPTGPRPKRIDERHVGVRFGDNGPFVSDEHAEGRHWHVTLNGVEVADDVDEAYAGRHGWVMLFPSPKRIADGVVVKTRTEGDVRVWTCLDVPCETRR